MARVKTSPSFLGGKQGGYENTNKKITFYEEQKSSATPTLNDTKPNKKKWSITENHSSMSDLNRVSDLKQEEG